MSTGRVEGMPYFWHTFFSKGATYCTMAPGTKGYKLASIIFTPFFLEDLNKILMGRCFFVLHIMIYEWPSSKDGSMGPQEYIISVRPTLI
jgi:hypothetical protein